MQLLSRLRYIMINTSHAALKHCLLILIRITQHNSDCANRVFNFPGLKAAIIKFAIEGATEVQNCALKLLRFLCLASKHVCQELVCS